MTYSLVMTTYNDASEIHQTLRNIAQQSVIPGELIIVDGGSSDNTCEIIKRESTDFPCEIVLISGKRRNISEGLNDAIHRCQYQYVGIAATGNRYESNFYELLLADAIHNDSDFSYGPIIGEGSSAFAKSYNKILLGGESGLKMNIASNHGCICRKKAIEKNGYFYEKFVYAGEDAEFYERALRRKYIFSYVKEARLYWRTPDTWKKYIRQMRNYVIAQMQMKDCLHFIEFYKYGFSMFLLLFLIIVMMAVSWKAGIVALLVGILYSAYKVMRIGMCEYLILLVNNMYPVICTIKEHKYLTEQYKVKN